MPGWLLVWGKNHTPHSKQKEITNHETRKTAMTLCQVELALPQQETGVCENLYLLVATWHAVQNSQRSNT